MKKLYNIRFEVEAIVAANSIEEARDVIDTDEIMRDLTVDGIDVDIDPLYYIPSGYDDNSLAYCETEDIVLVSYQCYRDLVERNRELEAKARKLTERNKNQQ